jgi:6-phosphogluconolactonase
LVTALSRRLAKALGEAIDQRGKASLVVSGGRTPGPLFAALSRQPIPWHRVWITLADERWVPPDHPQSNEGLVRRQLLQNAAAEARLVGLVTSDATPEAGVPQLIERLRQVPRPFDGVLVGMGEDGHTASLFPGAEELPAGLAEDAPSCLAVHPPDAPHGRISLSARTLRDSRWRLLHLTGAGKWRVLRRALADGPPEELPVRSLLRAGLDVYWSP